jgi:hypothetical protein
MQADLTEIFLSCSFQTDDGGVVSFVRSICDGLGFYSVNVNTASTNTPPEEARRLISRSAAVVAIATRRELLPNGQFRMPPAVHDEISIAYGLKKPLLLLREEGVAFEGFLNNYSTFLEFTRGGLTEPAFVAKLVSALSALKASQGLPLGPGLGSSRGFRTDSVQMLIALEETPYGLTWLNAITKRITFDERFTGTLLRRIWSDDERSTISETPMQWDVRVDGGSKKFTIVPTVNVHTSDRLDASLRIAPEPEAGDMIEFSSFARSPYINPIYMRHGMRPSINLRGRDFYAKDGAVPIESILFLHREWRFPASYGLQLADVEAFVGSHSFDVDYVVDTELQRAMVEKRSVAGYVTVTMRVENPLMRHMYGIAWQLPEAPSPAPTVSA